MSAVTPTNGTSALSTAPALPVPGATPSVASIAVDAITSSIQPRTTTTASFTTNLVPSINDHAARLTVSTMGLLGVGAISKGFTLAGDTTSLTLTVAGGQGYTPEFIEKTGATLTMSASVTNWVWLNGAGSYDANPAPYIPASGGIFLGAVTCSGSGITAIDYSGRMYFEGGLPYRKCSDPFKPGTSPSCTAVHLVKSASSTWLWDGSKYCLLDDRKGPVSLTDASSISLDSSLGDTFTLVLTGSHSLNYPTNLRENQRLTLYVQQGGSGSYTLSLHTSYKVPSTITLSNSTAVGKIDIYEFHYTAFAGLVLTNFQKGI